MLMVLDKKKGGKMIIKKSIVALMVAFFFTLSAGVALGGRDSQVVDKFEYRGEVYQIKLKRKKAGSKFIANVKGKRRNHKICEELITPARGLDEFMECLERDVRDRGLLNGVEKTIIDMIGKRKMKR